MTERRREGGRVGGWEGGRHGDEARHGDGQGIGMGMRHAHLSWRTSSSMVEPQREPAPLDDATIHLYKRPQTIHRYTRLDYTNTLKQYTCANVLKNCTIHVKVCVMRASSEERRGSI